MDEVVLRAMVKWPDVPAVCGWLALNRRGHWLIQGDPVTHPVMAAFISRNYASDPQGRWYFQNGPQRVYVTLACTPLVLRIGAGQTIVTHTGHEVRAIRRAWMDCEGALVVDTEHGPGVVDDRDVESFAISLTGPLGEALDDDALIEALERLQQGARTGLRLAYRGGDVVLQPIEASTVPAVLGFVRDPQPSSG